MAQEVETDLTRRFLIAASASLLLPRRMWADSPDSLVAQWKLDDAGDLALESLSGTQDAIASRTGHALRVGEGRNRALRLDGYSTWLRHNASKGILHGRSITLMAWVALEAYPVNEAALVQLDNKSETIFRFSIDRLGFVQFGRHPAEQRSVCKSSVRVPRGQWAHLAASAGDAGITLYMDGAVCGQLSTSASRVSLPETPVFVIGGSPDCPMVADIFPTGVLNGLLRDVSVFNAELTIDAVRRVMMDSKPRVAPDLEINGTWCVLDPQRPMCHAQPPRAWTNEPHGLIHWGGQYHLFYQKNPNGPYWGHIHWGHMTSQDLLHWTEMPVALTPDPGADSDGCWSGSVIDHDGRLAILYTGGDGTRSSIFLALSDDGIQFKKHPGNPVILEPPQGHDFPEFRDPFVWREGDTYYLIIGSAVRDVGGTALLYRSKDLVTWEYRKQLHSGSQKNSGTFWEMPIFVKAGEHHALIVCEVPGRASYWVGEWKDETFTPFDATPRRLELFNHLLSPTPMFGKDGQVTVMGIIPDERSPKETWAAGWAHLYSLPRALSTDSNGLLSQRPHESVEKLCRALATVPTIQLDAGTVQPMQEIAEKSLRLRATIRRGESKSVSLLVRRASTGQEQTEILYEWDKGRLTLDRSKSSLDPLVRRDRQETAYVPIEKDSIHLDVFVDRSVLEVFVDDRAAFAARIYPTLDDSGGVGFASTGGAARVENVQVARLERPF